MTAPRSAATRPVLAVRRAAAGGAALTVACPELGDGRPRRWGEARPGRLVHVPADAESVPTGDREGWA